MRGRKTLVICVTYRGIYDEDYIDYLVKLIGMAGKKGFRVMIDPHQDVVYDIMIILTS